jgi:hypothetical protein
MYHKATLVNLLEVLLYHKHVFTTDGEKLIELVDYIARKLTRLNGGYDFWQHTLSSSQLAKTDDLVEISKAAKDVKSNLAAKNPAQELSQPDWNRIQSVHWCMFTCAILLRASRCSAAERS